MKPLNVETSKQYSEVFGIPYNRLGKLSLEQYLGLTDGMNIKAAGRMLILSSEYTNDAIDLYGKSIDPRFSPTDIHAASRFATNIETSTTGLLLVAAEHCITEDFNLESVPSAIRENLKTISHVRSQICFNLMRVDAAGDSYQAAA